MPTRVSRASSRPSAVSLVASTGVECRSASTGHGIEKEEGETALIRSITAEIRAAFTHLTIAQLAYDMGQTERGDEAFAHAQQACYSARTAAKRLSESCLDAVTLQLEALTPVMDSCKHQRSDFHPTLRQPSLN